MLRLPPALSVAAWTRCASGGPLPCLLGGHTMRNGIAKARRRTNSVNQSSTRRWVLTDATTDSSNPGEDKPPTNAFANKKGRRNDAGLGFGKQARGLGASKHAGPSPMNVSNWREPPATARQVQHPSRPRSPTNQLHDLRYFTKTVEIPKHSQYPLAPKQLFVPDKIATGLNALCQKLDVPLQTDVDYQARALDKASRKANPGSGQYFTCELTATFGDFGAESTKGEGISKQAAKQAALYSLLAILHASGKLEQLHTELEPTHREVKASAPTKVNTDTSKDKRDSKMDIYNFGAALGEVPVFEVEDLKLRRRKGQGRRLRVNISLGNGRISASAVGTSLLAAEIAASVAFKEEAEKQRLANPEASEPTTILNSDNAKTFVEFYKSQRKLSSVEVEHESLNVLGTDQHHATISVDGQPVSTQNSYMASKKASVTVAYLTAAVELARTDPTIMSEYERSLQKGKGQVLYDIAAINLEAEQDTLSLMREGLLEARDAGLPDAKETLTAEHVSERFVISRYRNRMLGAGELESKHSRLLSKMQAFEADPSLEDLRKLKASLPINHYRTQVDKMIRDNVYSIVIGATGSGKTTQVPQILLEAAISAEKGASCNVLCTQPRRIAATSVARRVADERNERLQESVGYQVRFDARLPDVGGSITYCTTGILLEQLKHDPNSVFDVVSHIIIDEVHERDLNIDFLMIVLKDTVSARQAAGKSIPRIVLMSATLDPELFANYLSTSTHAGKTVPCPSISVPGRTFPVKEQYLGDIMHDLGQAGGNMIRTMCGSDKKLREYLQGETDFSKLYSGREEKPIIDWKRQYVQDDQEDSAVQERQESYVPTPLLAATIGQICSTTEDGAILAFLPGLEEITNTEKLLRNLSPFGLNFSDRSRFQICLLHSTVPKEEQAAIFQPSPPGCRKIILSTNIAETSVTVTDVKYVVDTGKMRESRYDQSRRITKLQCVWVSKSNAKQRAGRAGRVQNGNYYALFSQERHQSLQAVGLPELLRTDLSETALSVKANFPGQSVGAFLSRAIQPPTESAVDAAVTDLKAIEAFTTDEDLTDLGRVLDKLPVHPSLGKMIILGVIFRCIDPMLAFGAAAAERSIFVSPPGRKYEARVAHRTYSREKSDHLAFYEAFKELRNLNHDFGTDAVWRRSNEQYLHMGAFRSIDQTARQIESLLVECRLIDPVSFRGHNRNQYGPAELNINSSNPALVKSLLIAGLHPNIATKTTSRGLTYRTAQEWPVLLHPSSVNFNSDAPRKESDQHEKGTLFAYSTLARSADGGTLYTRDTSLVSPLMSALFGGKLVLSEGNRLEVNEWLPFFVRSADPKFAAKLILEFKKAMDRMLNGAFRSLQDLKNERGRGRGGLADDPIREGLARKVVQVLDSAAGRRMPIRMQSRPAR